jgi:hypothetical protein
MKKKKMQKKQKNLNPVPKSWNPKAPIFFNISPWFYWIVGSKVKHFVYSCWWCGNSKQQKNWILVVVHSCMELEGTNLITKDLSEECWSRIHNSATAAITCSSTLLTSNHTSLWKLEWLWTNHEHTHTLINGRRMLREKIREK